MIPISSLLCVHLRSDGAGSAVASTLSLVPSHVILSHFIPSGVIRSVRIYLTIFLVVVVVVALEISLLCTSYHQLPPPNQISALSVVLHA